MKEIRINDFQHLIAEIEKLGTKWIFRGVSSVDHKLIPKVGREDIYGKWSQDRELLYFDDFTRKAQPFVPRLPQSVGEWLSLGQHHGLPTRLLDWSTSPLTAAFFAVWDTRKKSDAAIYAVSLPKFLDPNIFASNPFGIGGVWKVYPAHVSSRIAAQNAVFTLHSQPSESFDDPSLQRLVIPRSLCEELKFKLHDYGLLRFNLFPGLDGLCDHISWRYELAGNGKLADAFRS